MIYLDHSATTPVLPEVRDYIASLMGEKFANPSSLYNLGAETAALVKAARKEILATLKSKDGELVFTGSGSEGNNLALRGIAQQNRSWGRHIITTKVEHPSVLVTAQALAREGYEVSFLEVDTEGRPDLEQLSTLVRKDTTLVSLMQVQNELGTIMPLAEAVALVKAINSRTLFHADGVQGYGRLAIDLGKLPLDAYTLSGHKIGAPKGVGALYLRKNLNLVPQITGGGQEKGLRAGTENFYYIGALALAAKAAFAQGEERNQALAAAKARLLKALDREGVAYTVNCQNSVPYILNLTFAGVRESEVLLHYLEEQEIYVSQASACHGSQSSETLAAIGLDERARRATLRFSFGRGSEAADMELVAAAIARGINKLF